MLFVVKQDICEEGINNFLYLKGKKIINSLETIYTVQQLLLDRLSLLVNENGRVCLVLLFQIGGMVW